MLYLSKRAMLIEKGMIPTLWYENKQGERHLISEEEMRTLAPPPEGFIYQHSQFPTTLHHNILRLHVKSEVDSCPHAEEHVRPTHGWVDGIEGRECHRCGGHQTRKTSESWPTEWDSGGSSSVGAGESGWSEDLALAMANSGDWKLSDAILIAANSCERCMNALAHKYGLKWGYPEFGEEWRKCGTECDFCKADPETAKFGKKPRNVPKPKSAADIMLNAALILDGIRERHMPDAPMAEPDLRFAIKAMRGSSDLVKLGLELLRDEKLHPLAADMESALEFNRTAVTDPRVARLLGVISKELMMVGFGSPDFITQLAAWQDGHGLAPSGKFDTATIAAFGALEPKAGPLPKNFGVVVPAMVYRGGLPTAEQLENLRDKYGVRRVVSLHDNPDIARICNALGVKHVPAFLANGGPEDLGRKVMGDSVAEFMTSEPTYIHCFFGADRTGSVVARMRTEAGWPCRLAYAEAKAYGFKDMFADLIDWLSEPCQEKLDIDTDAIRERMGDREPYKNPEISQDLSEKSITPAPTDLPFETSNSDWNSYPDTIVNTFGIGSIPVGEGSHGW